MAKRNAPPSQPHAAPMIGAPRSAAIGAVLKTLSPERPVLIAGPTASGKSALAMAIAEHQGGVIINADALQVYACFRVLTARPSPQDEVRLPHRLYGQVAADQAYSTGQWLRDISALPRHPRWIVTGGTGLYFRALTEGFAEAPPAPAALRTEALHRIEAEGIAALLDELDAQDPKTAARIDRANPRRVQRAWEVLMHTGRGLADWQDATPPPLLPLAHTQPFVVDAERAWLAERANRRVDQMLAQGAIEEVAALAPIWRDDLPAAKAIGAPALMAYINGQIDLENARDQMCLQTRQYIKRQQSWLQKHMQHPYKKVKAQLLAG